ncbi:zinc finger, CCHC-type containing protein [Tanacetum coccineum]|uniref:Zinc finger, CCHC-type containing protein n=1 Tax=Tanacetum coccineum TaxID=301880 RepID=A0ABQ5AN68_9ASTR
MVEDSWKSSSFIEENNIITLKKKLQTLKTSIRQWIKDDNVCSKSARMSIHNRLSALDKSIDQGRCNNELLSERSKLLKELHDLKSIDTLDMIQKAKIRWVIEGDENSKYFHGLLHQVVTAIADRRRVNPVHAYYNGSCTSKDNGDPSWSTSFKNRRTSKTSSALEALWKTFFMFLFVHDRNILVNLWDNRCSFHELRSEDPNQHLKDFLKLVDSLDLDSERSITTWEDLTTRFLAQFFPLGRTVKLRNDILMFQQHQGESLSKAWTRFKDLLQKVPHHGIDL